MNSFLKFYEFYVIGRTEFDFQYSLRWIKYSGSWQCSKHSNIFQSHLRRTILTNGYTTVGSSNVDVSLRNNSHTEIIKSPENRCFNFIIPVFKYKIRGDSKKKTKTERLFNISNLKKPLLMHNNQTLRTQKS